MPRSISGSEFSSEGEQQSTADYAQWTKLAEKRAALLEVARLTDGEIDKMVNGKLPY